MSPREFIALRDYRGPELSGRAVLLGPSGQLLSVLSMIELDGTARRMLLAPHKVLATIRFVGELDVTPAGKLARADA